MQHTVNIAEPLKVRIPDNAPEGVEPIMHLFHDHKGRCGCDLNVLFNLPEIRRLIATGHAECLIQLLTDTVTIVAEIAEKVELGKACTTTGKPC